jgi:hypothetical protein
MGQIRGFYQMPDCRSIRASEAYCLLYSRSHTLVTVRFDQTKHLDHLSCAALLAMPANQLVE